MGSKIMPSLDQAPGGRDEAIEVATVHFVNGHATVPPWPENMVQAMFGLGCFWGAERKFWEMAGVWSTQVGYAGGHTPNATYREVCTGRTGHNEVVRVIFDSSVSSYSALLKQFWENHDPTQGMQQGNDVGTQYRSGIYVFDDAQRMAALQSKATYGAELTSAGYAAVTTEIVEAPVFYYAEDYHQQYLAKNPSGYCGIGGTGVTCPSV